VIKVANKEHPYIYHHNYNVWYSIVLFALVEYTLLLRAQQSSKGSILNLLQILICQCKQRCIDSTIFEKSVSSPFPHKKTREICGVQVPVMLIEDSAFRFSQRLMKPYPFSTTASEGQRNFNYNLSKAWRVVENAFGHFI